MNINFNKKGIVPLIGIALMIVGLFGAMFLNYTVTDITSIVLVFAGAGITLYEIIQKKEDKSWKDYLFLGLIAVGVVLFVFGGFNKDTTVALVGVLVTVIGITIYLLFGNKVITIKK